MRSAHIGIRVSDLERSLSFYVDKLGCRLSHRIDTPTSRLAFITAGDTTFELVEKAPMTEHNGAIHLAFVVEDMDETVKKLEESGVHLDKNEVIPFQEGKILFFQGPDGETLELCQDVGTAL
ncbi:MULTISPECIES: VOC family protein [Dethiosulfovibrio]|jgi:lactoylglutathione lyase|uniref:VOC family protein n=2 Tax=Dethiosulfovibrio TaxID=47054 RepID=A0ABS9ENM4_9BACT|nr:MULTISPECIES: VOC family protein [Dethiosulfovibrio]MCF4114571.1 VOC family protein [Dethiosulfovibrio russensis]MCF4142795.1 VOC family protein [Dethiosulfovibrio marinus]MCF4144876.1 VOC family protein [Dethiosulfovibrio acidaminovorans]MEA3283899.1 VOC family protein [Synergistota bacterium]